MNPDIPAKSKEKPLRTKLCVLTVLFICPQLPSTPACLVQMQKFSYIYCGLNYVILLVLPISIVLVLNVHFFKSYKFKRSSVAL